MVRMIMRCKRELFSVDDLERLPSEVQGYPYRDTLRLRKKTPNSSNIKVIDERTIPDAAHIRRHGRLGSMVSNSVLQARNKTHAAFAYAAPSLAVLYSSDEYRNVQGDNGA